MKKKYRLQYDVENAELYKGTVEYREMLFAFSLNKQKTGGYRGRITVLDPDTGKSMAFIKKQNYSSKKEKKELKQLHRELSLHTGSTKEDRENYIFEVIQKIYQDNERSFIRKRKERAEPHTMTAGLAFEVLGDEYIEAVLRKSTPMTKRKKRIRLGRILADLSDYPMEYYSRNPKKAIIVLTSLSRSDQRMVRKFWDYVIMKERLPFKNPFNQMEDTGKTEASKRKSTTKMEILPKPIREALDNLLLDQHGGKECGAALVASGFSVKDACTKHWKDFIQMGSLNPDLYEMDFCIIRHERSDLMIAVHNYSRPLIPKYAVVLQRRYMALLKDYTKEEVDEFPIVSESRNPRKALEPTALQQKIRTLLMQAGIKAAVLKSFKESRNDPISSRLLLNTYKENLVNSCSLDPQSGTYRFLLGRSLGDDITSTNYVSYTSEAGALRLYNILRRIHIKHKHEKTMEEHKQDGCKSVTVFPKTSDEYAGLIIKFVLHPGQEATFSSRCGMEMNIKASKLEPEKEPDSKEGA